MRNAPVNGKNSARKSKTAKNDKPLCSHFGFAGHTQDWCYKLHGYPPGYDKTKAKLAPASVNQVSIAEVPSISTMGDTLAQLTNSQVQ